jgi:hypothetical protein
MSARMRDVSRSDEKAVPTIFKGKATVERR